MTTIAYRNGCLAADSLISSGTLRVGTMRKIARNRAGWMGGCTGPIEAISSLVEWIEGGAAGRPPEMKEADAIVVDPAGTVYFWTGSGPLTIAGGEYFAVGSGERVAMGAMAAGADAIQAVRIAIDLDTGSGGPMAFLFAQAAQQTADELQQGRRG